jgi:hypothetical protein
MKKSVKYGLGATVVIIMILIWIGTRYVGKDDVSTITHKVEDSISPTVMMESQKPYEISLTPSPAPVAEQPKLSSRKVEGFAGPLLNWSNR